jgi:predicted acylesterase/phospholipase RssA
MPDTLFFSNCLGVFQGGGCRAAALAGAYEAACDHGVHFAAVAGTSAGALVASLIGAGAAPAQVVEIARGLDFTKFLAKPDLPQPTLPPLLQAATRIGSWAGGSLGDAAKAFAHGGLYSSRPIEEWLDDRLAELLPGAPRPIRFGDLALPTYVVATDLGAAKKRVWSTYETPDDPVAFAVRASCSIPFFFQPVRMGEARLVDGGLLSALPGFVFAVETGPLPTAARILAFRLLPDDLTAPRVWSPLTLARRLLDAAIDGATDLQMDLQPDVHLVDIKTPGVSATDFHRMTPAKVTTLIEAGRSRTQQFLSRELTAASGSKGSSGECKTSDDMYGVVTEYAHSARDVIVSQPTAEWIWKLFPIILHWLMDNHVRIRVLIEPQIRPNAEEASRRHLLANIGVELIETTTLPFRGFLINPSEAHHAGAVLETSRDSELLPAAVWYRGAEHETVLAALNAMVPSSERLLFRPKLIATPAVEVISRLKEGVSQYRHPAVSIAMETVPLNQTAMVVRFVREWKVRQIELLVSLFTRAGLRYFEPASVFLRDGTRSAVTPPVVEQSGERYAVIEGHTRLFHCWMKREIAIECVVVRGVSEPLPAIPTDIRKAGVVSRRTAPRDWNHKYLRRIEAAMHPVAPIR